MSALPTGTRICNLRNGEIGTVVGEPEFGRVPVTYDEDEGVYWIEPHRLESIALVDPEVKALGDGWFRSAA